MIIRHNGAAVNARRQLNNLSTSNAKHAERLSSGLRINSAADDAAGLAISEVMRAQIRGLEQADRNVSDGISLIQTTDGALNEVTNILQRIRELAVQSSNDTNTTDDRQKMEDELVELIYEIDDISQYTNFNTKVLLDGSLGKNWSDSLFLSDDEVTLHSIQAGQSGGTATPVNWSNIGGQDLNWVRDEIADNLVPLIIENIFDTFSFASYFKGSSITVNLSTISGTGASASVSLSGTTQVTLTLNIGTGLLANSVNSSGYISDESRDLFHGVLAHEMTHIVMYTATSNLMLAGLPWFTEGMAQSISGHTGWGLSGTETDTQIRNMLGAMNSSPYNGGYYATMYLGYLVAGGGPVTNNNIAKGLNTVLGELALGYSLDSIINKYTNYTSASNYQQQLKNDADVVDFVRDLVNATKDGAGSVLAPLSQKNIISPNGNFNYTGNETYLKIDISTGKVINTYPPDYNSRNGGTVSGTGTPVHPNYDPFNGVLDPPDPFDPDNPTKPTNPSQGNGLYIQTAANAGQGMYIYIEGASSGALGIQSSSVLTIEQSQTTITEMDNAIKKVAQIRAYLGAVQNRLEHNKKSLGVSVEALSSSESKIRDSDMAKEMMEFIRTNIGSQAAQMMLAQANKQPEMVLMLLK